MQAILKRNDGRQATTEINESLSHDIQKLLLKGWIDGLYSELEDKNESE